MPRQTCRLRVGRVLGDVYAVADDPDSFGINAGIRRPDVGPHAVGDGHHGGGGGDGDPLGPRGQRVTAAELLGLPRPQRLQRVHGHHVRDAVQQRREVARPGWRTRCGSARGPRPRPRRPSTGRRRKREARRPAGPERAGGRQQSAGPRPGSAPSGRPAAPVRGPGTPRARPPRRTPPAGTRGSAVRPSQRASAHAGFLAALPLASAAEARSSRGTSWPFPTTVMPPGDTAKPRSRSCSLSTPTCAPGGTTTFLSMIAFCARWPGGRSARCAG